MRRQFGCALFLGTLVVPLPAAGQAPDTVRFTAPRIAVSLVHLDRGAASHRDTSIFRGPPRDSAGRPATALTVNLSTGVAGEGDSDPGVVTVVEGETPVFGF